MYKSCLSLLLALAVISQGCGSDFKPVPLVAVSGKISSAKPFDNKGLGIMFVDAKGSASGSAKLESDGTFKGEAPVGESVAYLYGAAQEGAAPGAGHADSSKSKTKKEFWNAETSPWKVTIPAEGKTDIDLSVGCRDCRWRGSRSRCQVSPTWQVPCQRLEFGLGSAGREGEASAVNMIGI